MIVQLIQALCAITNSKGWPETSFPVLNCFFGIFAIACKGVETNLGLVYR
jgi:hypothetical protein